ncbi:MAG: hypothetical protein ACK5JT_21130 [Hyphomicrobiaceae bacterium]
MTWRDDYAHVTANGLDEGLPRRTLLNLGLCVTKDEGWPDILRAFPKAEARTMNRAANGAVVEYVEARLGPDCFDPRMEF